MQIVRQALERIAQTDRTLNCFTLILADAALEDARALDAVVAAGRDPGALAGVPFAVKDLFNVEGLVTTAGSSILRDAPKATEDAIVVRRLKKAGGILIGTLNMDEFAYGFATENIHYGITRNPHDRERLAGGSSGGSAAAVGAGLVPLSLGSDTNGSIRVPASLCGIFGLRPTHDIVPVEGTFPFVDRLDTVGIFTRSVDDLRSAFRIMSDVPSSCDVPETFKTALLSGWFQTGGQAAALKGARDVFKALGGKDEVDLPLAQAGRSSAFLITASEGGQRHLGNLRAHAMDFDPATRDRLIAGALLPDKVIQDAEVVAAQFIKQMNDLFQTYDLLVAPSTPSVAPEISGGLIEINGEMVSARANLGLYTQPLSLAGVPILSAPLSRPGQLPLGVQIAAAHGREEYLFDAAERLVEAGLVAADRPQIFSDAA